MEMEDLSDWVAVKADIFIKSKENYTRPPNFICGWNDKLQKLAITLHENTRTASDDSCENKVCLLSLKELKSINKQLCLLDPNLETALSHIGNKTGVSSSDEIDNICFNVEHYLTEAVNVVGRKIVLSVIFDEDDDISQYEESVQELQLKTLENSVQNNSKELNELLKLREKAETLLQIMTIYKLEDDVCKKILISLSELYNFKLQPFIEIREIANNRVKEAKAKLKENVGPSIKEKAEKDLEKWVEKLFIASEAEQQMHLDYYKITLELVEGQRNRMSKDQNRYGKMSFALYAESRMLKLNVQVCEEELNLRNTEKALKEIHRDKIKNKLAYLNCNDNLISEIQRIEDEITTAHLDVLDAQLIVMSVKENLCKSQLLALNKEEKDKLLMDTFVDAVENTEEFASISKLTIEPNPKVTNLKNTLGDISRRKAGIRIKRTAMLSAMKKKKQIKEVVLEKNRRATAMLQKRKTSLEVKPLDSATLVEERKKTLQRLKKYKKRAIILEAKEQGLSENEEMLQNFTKPVKESSTFTPNPQSQLPPPPPPSPPSSLTSIAPPLPPPPPSLTSTAPPLLPPSLTSAVPPLYPPSSLTSTIHSVPPTPPPPPPPPLPPNMPSNAKKSAEYPVPSSSGVLVSETYLKQKLTSLKKPEVKAIKAMQPFSLDEILNIRSKLKKPSMNAPGDVKSNHPDDFNAMLRSVVTKVRVMVEESDSDRSEHSDFD